MSCVWACSLHETEPSEPVLSGISITNKTELTAEWHAGDADRTIVVALSPESFTSDNTEITVTSSGEAVTVDTDDKFKLHAVADGKATVTVVAGDFTDSVEITVSRAVPPLGGIAINATQLAAEWYIGEADRTVTVTYDPASDYNASNTPATVTSSKPEIVKVDGMKLKAVGAGTAKITATAGGKTATADITVKPVLTGVEIAGVDEAAYYKGDEIIISALQATLNMPLYSGNVSLPKTHDAFYDSYTVAFKKNGQPIDASKFTYGCKNSEFQEEVMRKKFYDLLTILLLSFTCVCAFAISACATGKTDPDDGPSQSVTYTVTFKQDGYADIVKTVEEGEDLAYIPTPATETGYTVTWDRTDFTNITQNVIVNAVKTANTYKITYSLGANNYATVAFETQEVRYGESFTLQTPSYQGSAAFYGWYFADEKGNPTDEKAENGTYIWARDICVIAKWQEWSDVVS